MNLRPLFLLTILPAAFSCGPQRSSVTESPDGHKAEASVQSAATQQAEASGQSTTTRPLPFNETRIFFNTDRGPLFLRGRVDSQRFWKTTDARYDKAQATLFELRNDGVQSIRTENGLTAVAMNQSGDVALFWYDVGSDDDYSYLIKATNTQTTLASGKIENRQLSTRQLWTLAPDGMSFVHHYEHWFDSTALSALDVLNFETGANTKIFAGIGAGKAEYSPDGSVVAYGFGESSVFMWDHARSLTEIPGTVGLGNQFAGWLSNDELWLKGPTRTSSGKIIRRDGSFVESTVVNMPWRGVIVGERYVLAQGPAEEHFKIVDIRSGQTIWERDHIDGEITPVGPNYLVYADGAEVYASKWR